MGNNNNTTQCDRIMKYFRMFGSITQDEADKEFGIKRLASIGGISTKNCHPFWDKEATAFLCANGTERCDEFVVEFSNEVQ